MTDATAGTAEDALVAVRDATAAALSTVHEASRQADVLRLRRDAIRDQMGTRYRRRSAGLPHLGEEARSIASEMASLRASLRE